MNPSNGSCVIIQAYSLDNFPQLFHKFSLKITSNKVLWDLIEKKFFFDLIFAEVFAFFNACMHLQIYCNALYNALQSIELVCRRRHPNVFCICILFWLLHMMHSNLAMHIMHPKICIYVNVLQLQRIELVCGRKHRHLSSSQMYLSRGPDVWLAQNGIHEYLPLHGWNIMAAPLYSPSCPSIVWIPYPSS